MVHAARQLLDRVLHLAHQVIDPKTRLAHPRNELARENAIGIGILLAQPVERLLTAARRVHDHLAFRRIGRIEPAAATDRSTATAQGIVPTGIDQHQAERCFRLLEPLHQIVQCIRRPLDFHFARHFDVDRQQVAAVLDLHAVSGEKDNDFIAAGNAVV